ncbi:OadG family protein [Oscillibacter sp. MSJ-2]|uniref:OadG family protein n=1 Tax=Dysosmobacter acutus TaxID=2841504 RepID=A0ABS6FA22_9FIRM|nr:OadG family transporter subunit [Dysosmobacter acutus]MBU5626923.1 OadG family protein [Dysosmobacter acutus]
MAYSNVFVCLLGIGTVFFGLICIIVLATLMSKACGAKASKVPAAAAPAAAASAPVPAEASIPNRQEMIAAISAAVADELGTDISAIRILSMKKL